MGLNEKWLLGIEKNFSNELTSTALTNQTQLWTQKF